MGTCGHARCVVALGPLWPQRIDFETCQRRTVCHEPCGPCPDAESVNAFLIPNDCRYDRLRNPLLPSTGTRCRPGGARSGGHDAGPRRRGGRVGGPRQRVAPAGRAGGRGWAARVLLFRACRREQATNERPLGAGGLARARRPGVAAAPGTSTRY